MFKPEGVYVAMLTPFKDDGSINEKELRRIVDFQIANGVDGLFPGGSCGESIHMTREEKEQLFEIVADQAAGRVSVLPGISGTTPRESICLAEKAKALGCPAVVAAPPHFFPINQEMMEKYFEEIADAVDLSVILYNIPLFSTPISYDVVKRLSRRVNIVGMKDSSGSMVDFIHFMDKVRLVGEDLSFLTGREETLFSCLATGGQGCMTASSGILPEYLVSIYRAFKNGDIERAKELQFSILLAVRSMFGLPFPIGFKVAMETRGFKMGPPRQPLSHAEQFNYRTMKTRIEKVMNSVLQNVPETA
ncbi:MAG: dihydrodipicolinate synthase family protein [Desulfobacterales bacterium]|nr:dihydrodipicolinate synthase family protein [Desulfobacterales bacterium]